VKIHLYMLCYRFEALVASHLDPESFGLYMATGTQKNTKGNVLFFEINPDLKSAYFHLDDLASRCAPHEDGSPKRSKYISIYRVLEHLDPADIGRLYLGTADGRVLGLESATYDSSHEDAGPSLYQELCPVSPMVVSALPPAAFVRFMTDPGNPLRLGCSLRISCSIGTKPVTSPGTSPIPSRRTYSTAYGNSSTAAVNPQKQYRAHLTCMAFSERSAGASFWVT